MNILTLLHLKWRGPISTRRPQRGCDHFIRPDIPVVGEETGIPLQTTLHKYRSADTATLTGKKPIVHPFPESDPPTRRISSDNGYDRYIYWFFCVSVGKICSRTP